MLTIERLNRDRLTHTLININTIEDFIIQLNDYLKPKDLFMGVTEELEAEINRCIEENAKFKYKYFFKKHIRGFIKPAKTQNDIQYWINRGYNQDLAKIKISEFQKSLNSKFLAKKNEFPELYENVNPTQIGYWIKRGYSEVDAIIKRSEFQRSFTLEKCIKKFGPRDGKIMWEERQKKWQDSLRKSRNVTWSTEKNSVSYEIYHKKYGNDWVKVKYEQLKKNKKSSKFILELFDNISRILYEENKETPDILSFLYSLDFNKVRRYSALGIIQYLTNLSYFDILSNYMIANKIEKISNKKYGNSYYKNGKYYKSDGEFEIGQYLESISAEFSTQKSYIGTRRFSDFYINKLDLYVELTGMSRESYNAKKEELDKKDFNIIWSEDKEFIKNYIYEKIHRN